MALIWRHWKKVFCETAFWLFSNMNVPKAHFDLKLFFTKFFKFSAFMGNELGLRLQAV